MKRFIPLIFLVLILFSGCATKTAKDNNKPINPKPLAQDVSKEISLYFLNDKMNGLVLERRYISKDSDIMTTILNEMIKGPSDEFYEKPVFSSDAKLLSVQVQDGTAFVNFSKGFINAVNTTDGDNKIDKLKVAAIINTITDIPGIDNVQFLEEGNKIDTIGNYYIGLDPLKREIITGDVYTNPELAKKWQAKVDLGKDTWRLDPILTLSKEGGIAGFGEKDVFTLLSNANGVAYIDAVHDNKVYLVTLIQPLGVDRTNIWTIDNVKAKFTKIPETKPQDGESFIYGIVKNIDYTNRVITIEREYQDSQDMRNQAGPDIKVLPDAIIHFQAKVGYDTQGGFRYAERDINFSEIKLGDELGIILNKNKEARAIIVSDKSKISYETNIKIISPVKNNLVTSPFKVIGKARVFEGNVNIRLTDKRGNILCETFARASESAPSWGDFETIISYKPVKEIQDGILEVFSINAEDGSMQNLVSVPLKLK
ncbi:MAG: Gmad2 immunoglobulin-like domain-containing protein [Thermoanaerobacteraceae bacterium]